MGLALIARTKENYLLKTHGTGMFHGLEFCIFPGRFWP